MKLTKQQLKRVIQEELQNIMQEQDRPDGSLGKLPPFTGPPLPPEQQIASMVDGQDDPLQGPEFPGMIDFMRKVMKLHHMVKYGTDWEASSETRMVVQDAVGGTISRLVDEVDRLAWRMRQKQISRKERPVEWLRRHGELDK